MFGDSKNKIDINAKMTDDEESMIPMDRKIEDYKFQFINLLTDAFC